MGLVSIIASTKDYNDFDVVRKYIEKLFVMVLDKHFSLGIQSNTF